MIRAILIAATVTLGNTPEEPNGTLTVRHPCYQPAPQSWGEPRVMDTNRDTRLLAYRTSEGVSMLAVEVADDVVCVIWSGEAGKGA